VWAVAVAVDAPSKSALPTAAAARMPVAFIHSPH
jgi:hypothetical protein